MDAEILRDAIRTVPDFPEAGIRFRDITPLLSNPRLTELAVQMLTAPFEQSGVTKVVGIESRGFILGAMIAARLDAGFVPVRKQGRLPRKTISESYDLEYGSDTLEIHAGDLHADDVVLIHDDLIATGGTALAAERLVMASNAGVGGFSFLVELDELGGRKKLLSSSQIHTVVHF